MRGFPTENVREIAGLRTPRAAFERACGLWEALIGVVPENEATRASVASGMAERERVGGSRPHLPPAGVL